MKRRYDTDNGVAGLGTPPLQVQVRCVSGDDEETLLIPLGQHYHRGDTVRNLMQALQRRVRRVSAEDLQQLELDCEMGGILHEEVSLQAVPLEGDVLHAGTVTAQVKLSREAD